MWQIDRQSKGDDPIGRRSPGGAPTRDFAPIHAKIAGVFAGHFHRITTPGQRKSSAMRVLLIPLGLFLYVATDITVNNGASVRGWMTMIGAMAHSVGHL